MNMMYSTNIPYPYDVPNRTLPDGTPGIWTMIGAAEQAAQEIKDSENGGTGDKANRFIDGGQRREDEK